jgi:hypothetical protein
LKPLFLEITADMLRYVPFVESAGMHYIGDTEGNLKRVNTDMNYVLRNYERMRRGEILKQDSGIVDLQVFYATALKRIQRREHVSRDHLLDLLLKSPHRLSDDDWEMLHRILRLPKPSLLRNGYARLACRRATRRRIARWTGPFLGRQLGSSSAR